MPVLRSVYLIARFHGLAASQRDEIFERSPSDGQRPSAIYLRFCGSCVGERPFSGLTPLVRIRLCLGGAYWGWALQHQQQQLTASDARLHKRCIELLISSLRLRARWQYLWALRDNYITDLILKHNSNPSDTWPFSFNFISILILSAYFITCSHSWTCVTDIARPIPSICPSVCSSHEILCRTAKFVVEILSETDRQCIIIVFLRTNPCNEIRKWDVKHRNGVKYRYFRAISRLSRKRCKYKYSGWLLENRVF